MNACREHIESGLGFAIVDGVALPQCPACKTPFWDFEACFAISCSSCPHKFCGWCFKDCGDDAHSHVRSCGAKPRDADVFFGSREEFEAALKQRRTRHLREFLATLSEETKEAVKDRMRQQIADLI